MAKVRYHEYRPGHWAKLVDGKVVGPATPEEAKAWQRQQAEEEEIWEDVVTQAEAPPGLQPEHAPRHAARVTQPPLPSAEPLQAASIWDDVLRQAAPPKPQREHAAEAAPRVRQPQEEEGPRRPGKPRDQPPSLSGITKLDFGTRPVKLPLPLEPALPEEQAKPESEPHVPAQPEIEPAPPKKEARAVSEAEPPPPEIAAKAEPQPGAAPEPSSELAVETRRPAKAKVTPPKKEARAVPEAQIPPPEAAPKAEPKLSVEAPAPPEPRTKITLPEKVTEAEPKPTRRRTAAPRRRSNKKEAARPEPRATTGQEYLWIMAGSTDDLATSVRAWLPRYEERFGQRAGVLLCHATDRATLEQADLPLEVRQNKGIPPHHFWIGPN